MSTPEDRLKALADEVRGKSEERKQVEQTANEAKAQSAARVESIARSYYARAMELEEATGTMGLNFYLEDTTRSGFRLRVGSGKGMLFAFLRNNDRWHVIVTDKDGTRLASDEYADDAETKGDCDRLLEILISAELKSWMK